MTTMPTTGGGRAADALAFMALDLSIEAAAGQSFGEGRPIALPHPRARA
jgi:hypothetical protein